MNDGLGGALSYRGKVTDTRETQMYDTSTVCQIMFGQTIKNEVILFGISTEFEQQKLQKKINATIQIYETSISLTPKIRKSCVKLRLLPFFQFPG